MQKLLISLCAILCFGVGSAQSLDVTSGFVISIRAELRDFNRLMKKSDCVAVQQYFDDNIGATDQIKAIAASQSAVFFVSDILKDCKDKISLKPSQKIQASIKFIQTVASPLTVDSVFHPKDSVGIPMDVLRQNIGDDWAIKLAENGIQPFAQYLAIANLECSMASKNHNKKLLEWLDADVSLTYEKEANQVCKYIKSDNLKKYNACYWIAYDNAISNANKPYALLQLLMPPHRYPATKTYEFLKYTKEKILIQKHLADKGLKENKVTLMVSAVKASNQFFKRSCIETMGAEAYAALEAEFSELPEPDLDKFIAQFDE